MAAGAIIESELRRMSRRRWFYAMRVAVGLAALAFLAARYERLAALIGSMPAWNATAFVRGFLADLIWYQGVALVLLVPGLVAGAIAGEDRRGMMTALLASRLTAWDIVLGKFAASLAPLAAAVLVTLPILALSALIGGLQWWHAALLYGGMASTVLLAASISLVISAASKRPRGAIVAAYLVVGSWLFLPPAFRHTVQYMDGPGGVVMRAMVYLTMTAHPLEPTFVLEQYTMALAEPAYRASPLLVIWRSELTWKAGIMLGIHVGLSLLLIGLSVVLLRPVRLGLRGTWFARGARRRLKAAERAARKRPPVGDDPIDWKERFLPESRPWMARQVVALPLAALAFCMLIDHPARDEALDYWSSGRDPAIAYAARANLNTGLRGLATALTGLALLATVMAGVGSIAGEKERDTWTSIRTSPLTGTEVARAKARGALRGSSGIWLPVAVVLATGVALGGANLLAALAFGVIAWVLARSVAAVGVACSMRTNSTIKGLVMAALVLLWSIGPLALVFWMAWGGTWGFVEFPPAFALDLMRQALGSPEEVRSLWDTSQAVPSTSPFLKYRLGLPLALLAAGIYYEAFGRIARWLAARAYDNATALEEKRRSARRLGKLSIAPPPAT
jgi:ABC-type transport system involved in multi-copper enzyme maturation permease subunit